MKELLVVQNNKPRYVDLSNNAKLQDLCSLLEEGLIQIPETQFRRSPYYFANMTEKLLLRGQFDFLRKVLSELSDISEE